MTPKRQADLHKHCYDQALRMKVAADCGKLIPRLDIIEDIYKILEELIKACPTEPG